MSWAEIKKAVNSDLSEPLSNLRHIDDLALFGSHSSTYHDGKIMTQIFKSKHSPNNLIVNQYVFDYGVANELHIGEFLKKISGINQDIEWDNISNLEDLSQNTEALSSIFDNEVARSLLGNSKPLRLIFINSKDKELLKSCIKNDTFIKNIMLDMESAIPLSENDEAVSLILASDNTMELVEENSICLDLFWKSKDENNMCKCLCLIAGEDPTQYTTLQEVASNANIMKHTLENCDYLIENRSDLLSTTQDISGEVLTTVVNSEKALAKYLVYLLRKASSVWKVDNYNGVWDLLYRLNSGAVSTDTSGSSTPGRYILNQSGGNTATLLPKLNNSRLFIDGILDGDTTVNILLSYCNNTGILDFVYKNSTFMDIVCEGQNQMILLNMMTANNTFTKNIFTNSNSRSRVLNKVDKTLLFEVENILCIYVCYLLGKTDYYYNLNDLFSKYNADILAKDSVLRIGLESKIFMTKLMSSASYVSTLLTNKWSLVDASEHAKGCLLANSDNSIIGYTITQMIGFDNLGVTALDTLASLLNTIATYNKIFKGTNSDDYVELLLSSKGVLNYINSNWECATNVLLDTRFITEAETTGTYLNSLVFHGSGWLNKVYVQKLTRGSGTNDSSYDTVAECMDAYPSAAYGTYYNKIFKVPGIMSHIKNNATHIGHITGSTYASKTMPIIVNSQSLLSTFCSYVTFPNYVFNVNSASAKNYVLNSEVAMNFLYSNSYMLSEYIQHLYGTRGYTTLQATMTNYGVAISTNTSILNRVIYKSKMALSALVTTLTDTTYRTDMSAIDMNQANKIFKNQSARNIVLNSEFNDELYKYSANLYIAKLSYDLYEDEKEYASPLAFYNENFDYILNDEELLSELQQNSTLLNVIYSNDTLFGKYLAKLLELNIEEHTSANTMLQTKETSELLVNNEETFALVKSKMSLTVLPNLAVVLSKLSGNEWTNDIDEIISKIDDYTPYIDLINKSEVAMVKCLVTMVGMDCKEFSTKEDLNQYGLKHKILKDNDAYIIMSYSSTISTYVKTGNESVLVNKIKEDHGYADRDFDTLLLSRKFLNELTEQELLLITIEYSSNLVSNTAMLKTFLGTTNFLKMYARNSTKLPTTLTDAMLTYGASVKASLENTDNFTLVNTQSTGSLGGGEGIALVRFYTTWSGAVDGYIYRGNTKIYSSGDNCDKWVLVPMDCTVSSGSSNMSITTYIYKAK